MIAGLVLLGAGFLLAFAGAFLIALYIRGLAGIGALGLWFLLPFALLTWVLVASVEPDWDDRHLNYHYAMGFIVGGIGIAAVCGPGTLIGGLVGRLLRKRRAAPPDARPGV